MKVSTIVSRTPPQIGILLLDKMYSAIAVPAGVSIENSDVLCTFNVVVLIKNTAKIQ